jgi:hypothetical protein
MAAKDRDSVEVMNIEMGLLISIFTIILVSLFYRLVDFPYSMFIGSQENQLALIASFDKPFRPSLHCLVIP